VGLSDPVGVSHSKDAVRRQDQGSAMIRAILPILQTSHTTAGKLVTCFSSRPSGMEGFIAIVRQDGITLGGLGLACSDVNGLGD
jgi:hypothetical protein